MVLISKTIKISILLAITSIAGFFIYNSTAGTMKIITTGLSTVKINTQDLNRLTNGLVGYWTFDGQDTNWTSATAGTVTDRSGQGNTGTLTNMSRTTSPVPGINGQGLYFNNDDRIKDYVDVGNGSSLGLTGSMTISAWIKMNITAGLEAKIVTKGLPCGWCEVLTPYNFGIDSTNKLNFSTAAYEDVFVNTSTDSISLNQWQHVVVARNSSSQVTFYINSVQDSGGWQAHTPGENGGDNVLIGLGPFTIPLPGTNGRGVIDEVRIYNRALSASEITELYNQGQAKINASQATKLTSGLVGYWTFDGQDTNWTSATAGATADKSPGGTNTGTLANMSRSTSPVPGVNGQALNFDGTNDYVSAGNNASLALADNMTISAWVYSKDGLVNGTIAAKDLCNDTSLYFFGISSAKLFYCAGEDNEFNTTANSLDSISLNQWQHVVLVRNDSQVTFYINGVQDSGGWQWSGTFFDNSSSVLIGASNAGTDNFLNGYLDEVRIYNRALSAAEITELYNLGR